MLSRRIFEHTRVVALGLAIMGSGVTAAPLTATGPCDIYSSGGTPCVAAHSTTRALYGAYSGSLYQVRERFSLVLIVSCLMKVPLDSARIRQYYGHDLSTLCRWCRQCDYPRLFLCKHDLCHHYHLRSVRSRQSPHSSSTRCLQRPRSQRLRQPIKRHRCACHAQRPESVRSLHLSWLRIPQQCCQWNGYRRRCRGHVRCS